MCRAAVIKRLRLCRLGLVVDPAGRRRRMTAMAHGLGQGNNQVWFQAGAYRYVETTASAIGAVIAATGDRGVRAADHDDAVRRSAADEPTKMFIAL
jgi:hypothetical protein